MSTPSFDFSSPLLFCKRCQAKIRETDNYCYNCGKTLKRGYGFLYTHTGIILMSLVIGPFALPLVWLSKKIGPLFKIIYTLILLVLGYIFVLMCVRVYSSMNEVMKSMNSLQGLSNLQNLSTVPGFTSINF